MADFHNKNIKEVLIEVGSTSEGLSHEQALSRLASVKHEGPKKRVSIISKFFQQFFDFMIIILLLASAISITIGIIEHNVGDIADGCIILAIVLMNAVFGVVQEHKAEKSLEALERLTEPEARVIRGGKIEKIKTENLVVGDIVLLEAGVIIPADLRLISSHVLTIDESALTGESQTVEKDCNGIYAIKSPLGERKNMAYKGTTVMNGRGQGVVVSVGQSTELGLIASVIKEKSKDATPLQKEIKKVGKFLTYVVLAIAVVTFFIEVFVSKLDVLEAFLTAVAISVAAIPESMPAVITIIMSMGVAKLAKQKAIIKRIHSVETLGACDVICSDKTGTITQNKMVVKKCMIDNRICSAGVGESRNQYLALGALLCNDCKINNGQVIGEGSEKAMFEFGMSVDLKNDASQYRRINEIPFDSNRKIMSVQVEKEGEKTMFCKGAPDKLIARCDRILLNGKIIPLDEKERKIILSCNENLCREAMRVIAIALKPTQKPNDFCEEELIFVGLVAMIDPPRREAKDAIKKCRKAGMRPVMITGDYAQTALAIAREVGLAKEQNEVLTGEELEKLTDEELEKRIDKVSVFARVSPHDKMRIVEILKKKGHIVAMTGDGVNDAPSLKKANIGIGMGKSGTDVTKEVADLIITDDNFATIIVAVEEGRKIYKNIQKSVKFLFSANFAELMSLFVVTLLFPKSVFLLPVQILFVNLITDSLPAIALGVEKTEATIMNEKPRSQKKGLFSNGVGINIVVLGFFQTLFVVSAFAIGGVFFSQGVAMTMGFYTLNMLQMFYLASMRTDKPFYKSKPWENKFFAIAVVFCFSLVAFFAFTPLRKILSLQQLNLLQWAIIFAFCLAMLAVGEIYKYIEKKVLKNK